ncbi:4'-phosphopantetheinyl transferase superfamily protein [Chitinophaga oryzae]|uniref:4'-phosphopantetheinyl transferase superfamily protein n=1 Tax=Chitinophaga oryzae TaxID=2725414 RepID=A0AAE6ZF28_9BACT|nr:4'-phosphopantetheinyl transferase superfamily protein [Chitinophaga oryzae]QJB30407.1 4'-phosphopantetheinyl transferase superfamily protein [Chitinophaga oryzae]QJB36917.1 4'-phosphopantetheinyl transferase superfamily protein [Chitinophaga oryzae]
MAVSIYYTVFDAPLPEDRFERLLGVLPEQARRKVLRFHRWQDAHASLLGKHLLLHAFAQLDRQVDLEAVLYTPSGRPYWPGGPDFNISHSGNIAVCAVDTSGRVGIDIEQNGGIEIGDFREQFTPGEWQQVMGAPDPVWQFYRYWTMKEATAKANGIGIVELPAVHILSDTAVALQGFTWTLTPVALQDTYAGHLATETTPAAVNIEEVRF